MLNGPWGPGEEIAGPIQKKRRRRRAPMGALAAMALLAGAAGCSNSSSFNPVGGGRVSLSGEVQPILTASCAISSCHVSGGAAPPSADLVLEDGSLYDAVLGAVNVDSQQATNLRRIQPGSADNSYLVLKLQGTQATVAGGQGAQMPFGAQALTPGEIQTIRRWIDEGALAN